MSELRKCKASINGEDVECLFHRFSIRSEVIEPSALIGGHRGGNIQYPVALVELVDGTMVEVPASAIKFMDTDNKQKVLYLCDRTMCSDCSFPLCKHTSNINYAENFTKEAEGIYFEKLKIVQSRRKNRRICKCHLRKKKRS